jgi:osmotically-inducible protein OsmY
LRSLSANHLYVACRSALIPDKNEERAMKTILIGIALALGCACANESTPSHSSTASSTTKSSGTVLAGDHASSKTTATDQPNNKADLSLVQDVRRALMDNDALSVAAKNLTAVARDGTVTLKGVVPSQEEKEQVEACVSKVTGVQRVESLITVKPG